MILTYFGCWYTNMSRKGENSHCNGENGLSHCKAQGFISDKPPSVCLVVCFSLLSVTIMRQLGSFVFICVSGLGLPSEPRKRQTMEDLMFCLSRPDSLISKGNSSQPLKLRSLTAHTLHPNCKDPLLLTVRSNDMTKRKDTI